MLTMGGIIHNNQDYTAIQRCAFERLDFYRGHNTEPFLIGVPKLTHREIRHLDAQLPIEDATEINASGIPESQLKDYLRMYRYFPNYAEIDL